MAVPMSKSGSEQQTCSPISLLSWIRQYKARRDLRDCLFYYEAEIISEFTSIDATVIITNLLYRTSK